MSATHILPQFSAQDNPNGQPQSSHNQIIDLAALGDHYDALAADLARLGREIDKLERKAADLGRRMQEAAR